MSDPTTAARVDAHWGRFFGVPRELLCEPTVTVVRHAHLGDWRGVWFFTREPSCIVSAPDDWVERIRASLRGIPFDVTNAEFLSAIFGRHLGKIVGPAYHGHVSPAAFRPCRLRQTIEIPFDDEAVRAFARDSDPTEWQHAGLDRKADRLTACLDADRIVALAGFRSHSSDAGDPGVITSHDARGRGYATSAVSRVVEQELRHGRLVLYQTLLSNRAAVAVAARLGFERYASHVAVRLAA